MFDFPALLKQNIMMNFKNRHIHSTVKILAVNFYSNTCSFLFSKNSLCKIEKPKEKKKKNKDKGVGAKWEKCQIVLISSNFY